MKVIVGYGEPLQEIRPDDPGGFFLGGDISNILVGAKRLVPVLAAATERDQNVVVKILTGIGDDARGSSLIDLYQRAGIDPDLVGILPGKRTAAYELRYSTIQDEKKLNYKFIDREGAACRFLFESQRDNVLRFKAHANKNTIFVTSGIGASRPIDDAAFNNLLSIIDDARRKGTTTVFNTELRPRLFNEDEGLARRRVTELWKRSSVVLCSYPDDVAVFPDLRDTRRKVRDFILEQGVSAAIISEGERGLTVYKSGLSELYVPALKIVDERGIVDTAGGSAALTASIVAALAFDLPFEKAAHVSVILARNIMSVPGWVPPLESIPTVNEIREALNR